MHVSYSAFNIYTRVGLFRSRLRTLGTHYHPTLNPAVLWTPSNHTSRPICSDSLNLMPPEPFIYTDFMALYKCCYYYYKTVPFRSIIIQICVVCLYFTWWWYEAMYLDSLLKSPSVVPWWCSQLDWNPLLELVHLWVVEMDWQCHLRQHVWMKVQWFKVRSKPTRSRLSLTHHANKFSRWAE